MPTDSPPDILIVVLDDVGVDQVSPYGYPGAPPTPTLQKLADEGVRFDQAWATPVCSPSRAAIMTGEFANRNHIGSVIMTHQDYELPLDVITLPEMLKSSGTDWSAAAVGKWHLATPTSPSGVDHAHKQGFDLFAGSMNNIVGDHTYESWERVGFDGQTAISTTFSTTQITDDAIFALGKLQEPFLLYVAYHAAHRPLMAPPEGLLNGFEVDAHSENSMYAANVVAADTEIARLLDALGDRRDHTLIVVVGDNGTPDHAKDNDGMTGGKGSFTEGGLRVPFIVAGPEVGTPGVSDALVSFVDVFPTLMQVAGVRKVGQRLDGVSLIPVLQDPTKPAHTRLYSETRHPPEGPPWRNVSRAARDATLKVVDIDGQRTFYRLDGFQEKEVPESDLDSEERRRAKKLEAVIDQHGP